MDSRLRTLALPGLLALLSYAAWADAPAPVPSPYGNEWPTITNQLTRSGITEVGSLNLSAFTQAASTIHWWQLNGRPPSVDSGARASAYYLAGQKTVYISNQLSADASSTLPQLELHEAMGALGYNDQDYRKSTALGLLAKMPEGAERDALANAYGQSLFSGTEMALRGGTSVSGGGDIAALAAKYAVLREIMGGFDNHSQATLGFLKLFPTIDFEPLTAAGQSSVVVKYTYNLHPVREDFTLYLPMRRWNGGEPARAALVREAAQKILELFPAFTRTPLRTFTPSGCEGGAARTVTYPAAADPNVDDIQDFRGALELGCRALAAGADSYSLEAPAIPENVAPKQAGNYYFSCHFTYGGANFDKLVAVAAAGGNTLAGVSWGIESGDFLEGDLAVGAGGMILFTSIIYTPPGTTFKIPKRDPPGANGTSGQSQLAVNGKTLTFRCEAQK